MAPATEAIDCHYTSEGNGPPIIFIHGIGSSLYAWDHIVNGLKSEFRCIRYDLRGHGDSPLPKLPFQLEDLVADLEHLRKTIAVDRAHFVGHSLGGMIGPTYAVAHPERVLTLGLLSTAAGRSESDKEKVMAVYNATKEQGASNMLDQLIQRWFTDGFMQTHPQIVSARKKQVLDTNQDVFLNVFRIYAQTEMAPYLGSIEAPALVLTGELDGGCNPRLNKFIAGEIPNSELQILEGLKHAILLEAPDRVVTALARFLSKHS